MTPEQAEKLAYKIAIAIDELVKANIEESKPCDDTYMGADAGGKRDRLSELLTKALSPEDSTFR